MISTNPEAADEGVLSVDLGPGAVRAGSDAPLYPLFLRVAGARCLVVGGGQVAARKVASLVSAGADVVVVSPLLGADLACEPAAGTRWTYEDRAFRPDDVAGCRLVVAATDDPSLNREVAGAARAAGALVNVVDDPEGSDFFVPSVVRRGPLQIAVSTSGSAPAAAAAIRRRLEALFPEEWGDAIASIGRARSGVLAADLTEDERRSRLQGLAALDIGDLLDEGGLARVQEAVTECISRSLA